MHYCFFIIANVWWLVGNNSVEDFSSQIFLYFSTHFFYKMHGILTDFSISFLNRFHELINLLRFPIEHSLKVRPQFVYFTSYLFYLMAGRSLLMDRLTMLPYFLILLISVFYIGKIISSRFTGLLAVSLTMMYPLIFESFRQFGVYGLHFPLTAMVSLCILMLLKCNNFIDLKYSVILGVCVGTGMLVGGQLIIFIGIPIVYIMINAIKNNKKSNPRTFRVVLVNIMLFLILATIISSFWWGNNFKTALWYLKIQILDPDMWRLEGWTGINRFSLSTITWHIRNICFNSIGPGLFIVFLFGLYALFKKKEIKRKAVLAIWLIVPVILFSLIFSIKQGFFTSSFTYHCNINSMVD